MTVRFYLLLVWLCLYAIMAKAGEIGSAPIRPGMRPVMQPDLSNLHSFKETVLGNKTKYPYSIPPSTWLNAPAFTCITEDTVEILGREIHFSTVFQELHKVTKGRFPVKQITDAESPFEVKIRGDCVYLDDDVSLPGLKKLTIYARKFISNGNTLTLKAPEVCHQIIDRIGGCSSMGKAAKSFNGADGKSGIASPLVEIYAQRVEGNAEIISEGSDGNKGEDGGDGRTGDRGPRGPSPSCYRSGLSCPDLKGYPGYPGRNGEDGRRAGRSGNGGNSQKVTLNTESISGLFKVFQQTGKGGPPARHGSGGRGGPGGEGGCGVDCRVRGNSCRPTSECVRGKLGQPGVSGRWGRSGSRIYPRPNKGNDGIIEKSILRKIKSLKGWFIEDVELLELIHRQGELLFQKNRTDEALEIFLFLQSVTDVESAMYKQVSSRMIALEQGFDFYGNSVVYASNLGWRYLKERTSDLLTAGERYETTYNTVKDKEEEERRRLGNLFLDFFSAILGFPVAFAGKNPQLAFDSTRKVFNVFASIPGCSVPTFNEAKDTLELRLNFANEYEKMEDFDLSTMNVSAVPIIMQSDFAKNKGKLVQEFGCLLDREGKSESLKGFERILDDFFRDGDLRISLINKIINLETESKQTNFSLGLVNEWKTSVEALVSSSTESIPMSVKQDFTDLLYSVYEQNEATITRSLYELAKAYQFMSLWKFDALENYLNTYGDRTLTDNLGSLNGMFHFVEIMQTLEDERNRFLNLISTSAGARAHTYTVLREFDDTTHPGVLDMLRRNGRFTVHLNLDPNNIITTGCSFCYNARLVSIYVELTGLSQPNGVPSRIYVKVSHMGDSYFLLPLSNGNDTVVHFQQKPEDVDGGHVIFFDRTRHVTSVLDPMLPKRLTQTEGNRFCHEYDSAQDFFGGQLCKSPYATYAITIPRSQKLSCNHHVSGMNCGELDFTRFKKVRIFLKARAWSDYVSLQDKSSNKVYSDLSQQPSFTSTGGGATKIFVLGLSAAMNITFTFLAILIQRF
ncbi:unnamed protein product [Clavelina lepadiformis]|uniref:Uncharacterized protein n=1 Tax=Clavelina lepadiformis TaxID=159417 RepID=A0ABP0GUW6_CLALP